MVDLLEGLNEQQREAVTTTEGFIRVLAGAGSGKTRALTHRFAYLVNEIGILPGNILCVTFTNKAANEMRQRIHQLTGDNDTGYINTFHGFCVSVLQEDSHAVSYPKSFLVLDNSDIDAMLELIYEERGLTLRDMTFGNARDMIEIKKLKEIPDYYEDLIRMSLDELYDKYQKAERKDLIIFYGYLYQQKKCFGLDYNDLLIFTLHIFQNNDDIRQKWQERLEYIMIDEFQDIDAPQYKLMRVLCDYHKNLFVVGDPDQTIYSWRGADAHFLTEFSEKFPKVKTIYMMHNYRSTPNILRAANDLIRANKDRLPKDLIPELPEGTPVLCHMAGNSEKEGEWIAKRVKALHEDGWKYRDMTILYRAHYLTLPLEQAFLKNKLPYTIYSGTQFFDRMEIKDAMSYLRMVAFKDDLSFRRVVNVPKRNIGQRRMAFLEDFARQNDVSLYTALRENLDHEVFRGTRARQFVHLIEDFAGSYESRPVSELLSDLLNQSGYEEMMRTNGSQERLDNLAELKQSIYEYEVSCGEETTLDSYLKHAALFTNADTAEKGDKVRFMTVHAAKGLEFPIVFLAGMNEGTFPSRKVRTLEAMEEERRLSFVAVTRAEQQLVLTAAEGRNLDGTPRYPSRFLFDIGVDQLVFDEPPREGLIKEAKEYIEMKTRYLGTGDVEDSLFDIGDRVEHPVMGLGTILERNAEKSAYLIRFDDMPTPRAISYRAKLKATPKGEGEGNDGEPIPYQRQY
ncbi:MAG: UvrD-helicase domain-containing protein [Clostridia bacterium]|nr:UvrD-helicase domain-containing protein [Clostridia bacterium]